MVERASEQFDHVHTFHWRLRRKKKSSMSLSGHSKGVKALIKLPTMSDSCKIHSLEAIDTLA